jgi:hypothetical protein
MKMVKKLEVVNLKKHPKLNEKWIQDQIVADPTILRLGDIEVKDIERRQPGAGRLDLLLYDSETLKRYEVEIQLGATDESHIIRTIEYWDIERRRYPQYAHTAVIVAEEITSRFLNVIHLFNGYIPIIALKLTAYQVGDEVYPTFVKVLDAVSLGLVDEDEPVAEAKDRPYWESKASKATLSLTDDLLNRIVKVAEPTAALKYNKHYIGLVVDGAAFNFVSFTPKKAHVIVAFRLERSEEVDAELDEAGVVKLAYDAQFSLYRVKVDVSLKEPACNALIALAQKSRASFGKGG